MGVQSGGSIGGDYAVVPMTGSDGRQLKALAAVIVDQEPGSASAAAASTPLAGSTAVSAELGPFTPVLNRPIWVRLAGAWAGTVTLLRSRDGGASKLPLTYGDGSPKPSWTGNMQAPVAEETVVGATYYLSFVRTSGALDYRVEQ